MHIRLCVAEEQEILREAYEAFFPPEREGVPGMAAIDAMVSSRGRNGDTLDIKLVSCSENTSAEHIVETLEVTRPDVLLLGVQTLRPSVIQGLEMLKERYPAVAIVLLCSYYNAEALKALRQLSMGASCGGAYLLKHTINSVGQLSDVIQSVSQGHVMVDPAVMGELMGTMDPRKAFLKNLSDGETQFLSWMARGYSDKAIASILDIGPKAAQRYKSGIYSKLGVSDSENARVQAVIAYLGATGQMGGSELASSGLSLGDTPETQLSSELDVWHGTPFLTDFMEEEDPDE